MLQPLTGPPRRRTRLRAVAVGVGVLVAVCAAAAVTALVAWPHAALRPDPAALARVGLTGFAGRVEHVVVRDDAGRAVPVRVRHGALWPASLVAPGERLTVDLTVRRPRWAGWLVGRTDRSRFVVRTPAAHVRGRWLQVRPGGQVVVSFDHPVRMVDVRTEGRARILRLGRERRAVAAGVVARGSRRAGSLEVAAVARAWERLPAPVRVSWFPPRRTVQALVEPAPGTQLSPGRQITITFSRPVRAVLGAAKPRLGPAAPGQWRLLDAHTIAFRPAGAGFGLGSRLLMHLPVRVGLARSNGAPATRTLAWPVREGSLLRLQQLLAEAGYLPVGWTPSSAPVARTVKAEVAAALDPPPGRFAWRFPGTPPELRRLWHAGEPNDVTRGAVMMFEDTHGLDVDGFVGPKVWRALLADAVAGRVRRSGYSYVYVHRNVPQSLNLWHDGRVIVSSPGNTGVPAAPTQLGTFPVFEHIPVGRMSGTNPDGTHYNDPGIRYISYFNHGDAIHAFNRASFGTPQSLGCVELPLAAAARVWPYTPIGTLVTIEN